MGIEIKRTCDICNEETGIEGSGSGGEFLDCRLKTPGGVIYGLIESKTQWIICSKCWYRMLKNERNKNNV